MIMKMRKKRRRQIDGRAMERRKKILLEMEEREEGLGSGNWALSNAQTIL